MLTRRINLCLFAIMFFQLNLTAQTVSPTQKWGDWKTWGDQGDGTYRNPVLPGDYSDIDCIRVDDDYYAVSSTFLYSPGFVSSFKRYGELEDSEPCC